MKAEKCGTFGQSWRLTYFSAQMTEPQYQTLIGVPLAWTAGTNGVVSGEPVMVSVKGDGLRQEGNRFRQIQRQAKGQDRFDDGAEASGNDHRTAGATAAAAFPKKVNEFLKAEGALIALQYGADGDGGRFSRLGADRERRAIQ